MNRLSTDSKQFGALRMLDEFVQSHRLGLSDHAAESVFLKKLSTALREHRKNPALIHGFRAQTMFAYLAAALGGCKIITEEDSGEFYVADPEFKRPDFRILTHEGKDFLVEVKNYNQSDPKAPFVLKAGYPNRAKGHKPLRIGVAL
jgi:hypothetical protein